MKTRLLLLMLTINIGASLLSSSCVANSNALIRSIKNEQFNEAVRKIEKGADVNKQNKLGYTALMHASKWGNEDIIKLLLKAGADVNTRALKDIETIKPTDLVKIKRHRNKNKRYGIEEYTFYKEITAIMIASDYGHAGVVTLLLEEGAYVNVQTNRGYTALLFASRNGHIETIKLLIEAGASVNTQAANCGETALMFASEKGHIETVKLLLNIGADRSVKNCWEYDALMLAARADHIEIVKILANKESDLDSALSFAKTKKIAEFLISAGADVSSSFAEYPALPRQSRLGNTDVVTMLLSTGADVNTRDENWMGATALSGAAQFGHIEILRMLMEAGADVNARDNEGRTALMSASENGHTDIVEMLINEGVDVNACDNKGWTALMVASNPMSIARCGSADLVRMLIEAGADINARNKRGRTALMEVSDSYDAPIHLDVMQMLIDRGADVNLRTVDYGTALWYAKARRSSEKIELLKRAGAK